jgi:chromosome partitioning protein
MSTKTIAILNQKGGVGKTTTSISLASALAIMGHSVLLVDSDPQGNATSGLGLDKQTITKGTYEVLLDPADIQGAIVPTYQKGLYVLPSNANLAGAEIELVTQEKREWRLAEALKQIGVEYCIIDCPPSLGLLSINALIAADYVLVPLQTEYYALEGLGQLVSVFQRVKQAYNPKLELLGVLLTMYDSRTMLSEQVKADVEKHFGKKVFKTSIPRNVRLAEAPSFGKSIFDHDKWSKGARAYKAFAKEVLQRCI